MPVRRAARTSGWGRDGSMRPGSTVAVTRPAARASSPLRRWSRRSPGPRPGRRTRPAPCRPDRFRTPPGGNPRGGAAQPAARPPHRRRGPPPGPHPGPEPRPGRHLGPARRPPVAGRARELACAEVPARHVEDSAFTTELVVSEPAANAIRYGSPPCSCGSSVTLEAAACHRPPVGAQGASAGGDICRRTSAVDFESGEQPWLTWVLPNGRPRGTQLAHRQASQPLVSSSAWKVVAAVREVRHCTV